ncbi:MAG: DUF421 domain-containing protein [Lentisphaeria bacterium]|nr:DUF421 domain-containing protein [Lentisphaeria bacterium]
MFDFAYFNEIAVHVLPKLLAGFLMMLVYIHLSGKGALAPISAIDQVGNVALGAIIGGTLFNMNESVFGLIAVVGFWAGLLLLLRYFTNRHMSMKNLVDGESIRLMQNGRVVTSNFGRAGLSVRDFIMLLHQRGYRNLDELNNVWYEYNGQLTVVKKGDESTATVVIESGEINRHNLERIDRSEAWLQKELKKRKVELGQVFCAEWHDGRLWLYPFEETPEEADVRLSRRE